MSYSIAFLGTYHPAVPTLRALAKRGWVSIVVLPEEAGKKNDLVIEVARASGIPTTYRLKDIEDCEVNLVLAANYPKIVPKRYLEYYPCINTHWSMLPKYRGVHGTAWAVINGDEEIGCSIHWMTEHFDEGDVLAQVSARMEPSMVITDLHKALADRQAEAVIKLLEEHLQTGEWQANPQDHSQAIYVPQRVPEDGIIDWTWPTMRIWNLVRALPSSQYPGAFTFRDSEKLVIWKASPVSCPSYFCTPGQVVRVIKGGGVWIKTGDTCLLAETVELSGDGSGPLPADEVLKRGDKLGFNNQLVVASLLEEIRCLKSRIRELEDASYR